MARTAPSVISQIIGVTATSSATVSTVKSAPQDQQNEVSVVGCLGVDRSAPGYLVDAREARIVGIERHSVRHREFAIGDLSVGVFGSSQVFGDRRVDGVSVHRQ